MSTSGFDPVDNPFPGSRPRGEGDGQDRLIPLGPDHLDACLALDAAALGGLWSAAQWRRELEEPQRPGVGLLRADALLAMACGALVLDELHITLVAVDPHRRRQGLGRRVLRQLLSTGRRLGAERATLEVSAGNGEAQALYASCGFRTAGRRRRYYRDGSDALIQWSDLLDDSEAATPLSPQVG
ncbi:GNAT family N-acetyltransferase [Synechococcus sp. CBW1004]|uniref:GNAT family N-acetyltransferase n=1 Tax=Synechococcus sp. CBW1004 TaxID=1353136 RepID=UPI0018CD98C3|nr:GNAT family N-acetyltransferase [Synechococcus sp. CBW1004]QPN64202.1 GNAT family N-acetyltransferase [Synechococcus sp. CBW1004]